MHSLLQRIFEKRGIKDTKELSTEERQAFDRWEGVLSGQGDITLEKLAVFMRGQQKLLERNWRDLKSKRSENERGTLVHMIYGVLLEVIEGPKAERAALEKYLMGLLDEP